MRISDWSSDVCSSDLLFELKDYEHAIAVAEQVIKAQGNVTAEQQRLAWSVTGDAQFALAHYPQAETAFADELKRTPANTPQSADVTEQLAAARSEAHTSELQSLMRISYAFFCLKKT